MEPDLSEFDKNVMDLFDVCQNILTASDARSISSKKNPFRTRLEKYINTYKKSDPEEHVIYFERVYEGNQRFILLGPQRDVWLTDGDIVISYGEDCGLKTDFKMHLSVIYKKACELREEIEEEEKGLPNSAPRKEVLYPDQFLRCLYRIFREINTSENDRKKLAVHIDTLNQKTGV